MNGKQITAFAAAGLMTLCTAAAILGIGGSALFAKPVFAAPASNPSVAQNAGASDAAQVQQLQSLVSQYQAREQQYQQALDQAQSQLQQDQQQLQQYQALFNVLQQRGILTLRQGDGD